MSSESISRLRSIAMQAIIEIERTPEPRDERADALYDISIIAKKTAREIQTENLNAPTVSNRG